MSARRLLAALLCGFASLVANDALAQNLAFTTDFRQLYATVARDWWSVDPETVVRGRFEPLRFLRTRRTT